jgi:hypothetical protein
VQYGLERRDHDHDRLETSNRTALTASCPIPPIKLRAMTMFPEEIRGERIGFTIVEITKEPIRTQTENRAATGSTDASIGTDFACERRPNHMRSLRLFPFTLVVFALTFPTFATTYIVPQDRELIQRADDIVIATGLTSHVERDAIGSVVTRYTLRIEEVLKGKRSAGEHLVLTERGGTLDGRTTYIFDTPAYEAGERYLVFTDANRDGDPTTWGMQIGRFVLETHEGRTLAIRAPLPGFDQNLEQFVDEGARDFQRFERFVRAAVLQRGELKTDYFVARPSRRQSATVTAAAYPRQGYLLSPGLRLVRPNPSFVRNGTQPGLNGPQSVSVALAQWNRTASSIAYTDGGVDETAIGGTRYSDGKNGILFNDPNAELWTGVAGLAAITSPGSTYEFEGEFFVDILEADVVIGRISTAQGCLNTIMTHEIGHTLGFRHANQDPVGSICGEPYDCGDAAVMTSVGLCRFNGVLQEWDRTAAETVYGNGPVCLLSITSQPRSRTIDPGETTTLSITATGNAPLTYQWFIGEKNDQSHPIAGATAASVSVTPTETTRYWAMVTNPCGSASSGAATVTVGCNLPEITSEPTDPAIAPNGTATLTVAYKDGQSVTWYQGGLLDRSTPVGNTATITVGPLATTTTYWAAVRNSCGEVISQLVTVNVACTAPSITSISPSQNHRSGESITLAATVAGTAPLTYQWFEGRPGDVTIPIGTNASTLTVAPTKTTTYWLRVTNACNTASSNAITITIASRRRTVRH